MKKIQIKPIIFFFFVLIQFCGCNLIQFSIIPNIHQGFIDLSTKEFNQFNVFSLKGPWDLYWMKLVDPTLEIKEKGSIPDIKGINFELWTKYSLIDSKLPAVGYATYRTRVLLPKNTNRYGIFYSHQFSSARLFINGVLLSETGFVSNKIEEISNNRSNTIVYFDTEEKELDIILQIGNKDYYQGGARADFLLGSKEGIEFYVIKNIVLEMLVFGLILGASVYHFLFFLLNRTYLPFLLFSLMCSVFLIRIPFQNIKVLEFIYNGMSWVNQIKILHLSNVTAITLGMYFLRSLVPHANNTKISKAIYFLHLFGLLFGFLGTLMSEVYVYRVNFFYTLVFLPIYLFHSGYVVYLNYKEKTTFYLLALGFIGLGFFANLAIVINYYGYQGGSVLLIGLLSFILTHSLALGRFFSNALETRAKMMADFSKKNEKELTVQREELQIMMHDSLGSELTDIHVSLERMISDDTIEFTKSTILPLHSRFQNIISSFRNQLLFMEDLNTAYDDLFTGLNLTVLRRYSDANREVDFEISNQAFHKLKNTTFHSKSNNPKSDLFYLITELCTNDLKYGTGESIWRLGVTGKNLTIFQSNIIKDLGKKNETNLKSALTRVENLNGEIRSKIIENRFEVNILIPLKD